MRAYISGSQQWNASHVAVIWLALMTTRPLRRTIATHAPSFPKSERPQPIAQSGVVESAEVGGERGIHFDNEGNSNALRHFAGQTIEPAELSVFVPFRCFIGLFTAPEAFAIVATHECDASMSCGELPIRRKPVRILHD